MDKYFKVEDKEVDIYKDFTAWTEQRPIIQAAVKELEPIIGIEINAYIPDIKRFAIADPSKEALAIIKKECNKPKEQGIYLLKACSKYTKAWLEILKQKNIEKILSRPSPYWYIRFNGRCRSLCNMIEGTLYGYVSTEHEIDLPKGYVEIKASEYHKVIEDAQENAKKQQEG